MSLKTDNEALREQVKRLTERLQTAGEAGKLQDVIKNLQILAASQQEEIEHLRTFKARHEQDIEKAIEPLRKQMETDFVSLSKSRDQQLAKLVKERDELRVDNRRLRSKLDEIAKGAQG